jgi:hypothetical protein
LVVIQSYDLFRCELSILIIIYFRKFNNYSFQMAATLVKPPNSTYTFSSQPKAVQQEQGQRQKFRQLPLNPP